MTRTSLTIDDDLLKRIKERATREGSTLQGLVNDLLRQALGRQRPRNTSKLILRGWKAVEQPGVDLLDRDALFDVMGGRN
jgi:metal-responsive CopG/Arc/MetJ family transcriptional regulator